MTFAMVLTFIAVPLDGNAYAASGEGKVTPVSVTKKAGNYTVKIKQTSVGSTKVKVTVPYAKKFKKISKVKVSFAMTYKGKTVKSKSATKKIKDIKKNGNSFTVNLPAYGKYKATVRYYNKKGKVVKKFTVNNVGAVASEYNIAVLSGTMGPLIFSMDLWDNLEDANGNTIPTIISLTRPTAYNWKKLPKGATLNPLLKSSNDCSFNKIFPAAEQYVKDLHKLNKYSKFHFHLTDFSVGSVMFLADRNKLSESLYDVSLYSDGSGSYAFYNKAFAGDNAQSNYNKMASQWNAARKNYRNGKSTKFSKMYLSQSDGFNGLKSYAYVAVNESSNVKWYVTRKNDTFQGTDTTFLNNAKSKITEVSLNGKLNSLKDRGLDGAFKALYHFDDQMFSSAKGKKVMVLMGSRVTSETYFKEFSTFIKKYYGSEYAYYYKGHPATPTKLYPQKEKDLKEVGIEDVESSIPAELILFFFPDIYVSGMSNSTLNLSYKEGNTKVYFGTRYANRGTITGGDLFEIFFTKITDSYEGEIKELCGDDIADCFLVEYAEKDFPGKPDADFGIYNYKTNTITNYKWEDLQQTDPDDVVEPDMVNNEDPSNIENPDAINNTEDIIVPEDPTNPNGEVDEDLDNAA